jgi:hypothetical protein
MAIIALVLGLLVLGGIGSILALVYGYQGRALIHRSMGRLAGRGMATAGIVLGWLGIAGMIVLITVLVAVPVTHNVGAHSPGTYHGGGDASANLYVMCGLIRSRGYECSGWTVRPADDYGAVSALCGSEGRTWIVLWVYPDSASAERAANERGESHKSLASPWVEPLGPNWSVECGDDEDLCASFPEVLGGELRVFRP